jgi:hypothetical protein
LKMHHAAIDGVAGAEITGAIHDTDWQRRGARIPPARHSGTPIHRPRRPARRARARLLTANLPSRLPGADGGEPGSVAGALREGSRVKHVLRYPVSASTRAFNGRISGHRVVKRFFCPRRSRRSGPGARVTVNDVIVTYASAVRTCGLGRVAPVSLAREHRSTCAPRRRGQRGTYSMMTLSIHRHRRPLERLHQGTTSSVRESSHWRAHPDRLTQTIPAAASRARLRRSQTMLRPVPPRPSTRSSRNATPQVPYRPRLLCMPAAPAGSHSCSTRC